jgi:basic membrane protein A
MADVRITRNLRPVRALAAAAFAASLTLLSACGAGGTSSEDTSSSGDEDTSSEESSGSVENVGLMMDLPRNDGSFGQATADGAQEAADELGAELTIVDSLEGKPAEATSALSNLAEQNEIVVVVANAVMADLPRVAAEHPDVIFAVDAAEIDGSPNIFYRVQNWYPLGYLAGVAAATASETGTIGFVGGGLIPPTIQGQAGFEDGAASVDPDIEVLDTITNSFTDPTLAKNAAAAQLAGGADVLYSFLDAAHAGAVQAAVEAGGEARLIGVISPKCDESEGLELGDTMADQSGSIANLVRLAAEGETESAVIGLDDPEVQQLAFCEDADVSDEIRSAVDEAWDGLASGEIPIPETE